MDDYRDEVNCFHEVGFLFKPSFLPYELVEGALKEVQRLVDEGGPHIFYEEDGDTIRAIYGLHEKEGIWKQISHHAQLVQTAESLLGEEVYVFQWKVNFKAASKGDVWEWHRDFPYWHAEDGMPSDKAVTAAILLDEVTEENGPLLLLPGTHLLAPLEEEAGEDEDGGSPEDSRDWSQLVSNRLKYTISSHAVERLQDQFGLFKAIGPPGSVTFFHCSTIHGSRANVSPFDRRVAFVTYNPISNAPRQPSRRPSFFVNKVTTRAVALES